MPVPFHGPRALALALLAALGGPAAAQAEAPLPRMTVSPRVAPSALYSGTRGVGIGLGVEVGNAGWPGSRVIVDGVLQQRFRSATASLVSADAGTVPVRGVVTAQVGRQVRRRFFGLGPFGDPDRAVWLTGTLADAELRLGVAPLGHTGLTVEPGVRLLVDRLEEVAAGSPAGLDDLDAPSAAAVRATLGETRTALSAGVAVGTDLRDSGVLPTRGTLARVELRRIVGVDGSGFRATRVGLHAEGFAPLGPRTTLVAQAAGVVLRADGGDGIPLGYLPALDERFGAAYPAERYVGRDALAAGLGVRQRVVDGFGVLGLDALVLATLGNAYTDVTRQFKPAVSFRERLAPDADGRAPLRPGLVVGLGLVRPDRGDLLVGGQIGVSPGGLTLGLLQVTADLGGPRPRVR